MGHDEHLMVAGHVLQLGSNQRSHLPPDSGIDFIEHQRGNLIDLRQNRLQGQHDPRQLSTAGHSSERSGRKTLVDRDQELDVLCSTGFHIGKGLHLDLEGPGR